MKIFYTDTFKIPLPAKHSFPKNKYPLLRKRILAQLGDEAVELSIPDPATDEEILRAHDGAYFQRFVSGELAAKEIRRVGLPWSPQIVQRDALVFQHCRRAGVPVAVTLAGGYAPQVQDTVDINFQTILTAMDFQRNYLQ